MCEIEKRVKVGVRMTNKSRVNSRLAQLQNFDNLRASPHAFTFLFRLAKYAKDEEEPTQDSSFEVT